MPKKATRRRAHRRSRSGTGRSPNNITVRHGRLRYRARDSRTPKTFSTALAKRVTRETPRSVRDPVICKMMRVPRQHSANCWLNAAIMSFFASEGMGRATRTLQKALIDPRRSLPASLRPELRQLALAIHSVPRGLLTAQYSTARLIPALRAADKAGLTTPHNRLGAAPGTAHNPVWFFTALASLLLPLEYSVGRVDLTKPGGSGPYRSLEAALAVGTRHNATHKTPPPQVLLIEAGQETAGTRARMELETALVSGKAIQALGRDWRLDSLAMLDTTDAHFGGVVTCAGSPHTYDGITGSRIHPKRSWRQVFERLVNKPIPTPSREEFRYDVRTGYVVFALVPTRSISGRQR